MARTPAAPLSAETFDDLPASAPEGEREVMKVIFEREGYCPQAIGEDAPGKLATADSAEVWWNGSAVTQTVYRRGSDRAIPLLPGDCVVGKEFVRYSKLHGGPLVKERPAVVTANSRRNKAYFDARAAMDGPIAEAAGKVQSPHGRVLPLPPRTARRGR